MVEYNQCQASLKPLYDLGIPGKHDEFSGYRILSLIHGRNWPGTVQLLGKRRNSDIPVLHRIKSICRSANNRAEAKSLCKTRSRRPASNVPWQLPFILLSLWQCAEHGRVHHGSFCWERTSEGVDDHSKSVSSHPFGIHSSWYPLYRYKKISVPHLARELALDAPDTDFAETEKFIQTLGLQACFLNPGNMLQDQALDCRLVSTKMGQVYEEKFKKVGIKGAI